MKNPDILFFFDGFPRALALYQALEDAVLAAFPDTEVRVQKTQVSFYCRRMFACASLPRKKMEGCGRDYLLVTLGLPERLCACGVEEGAFAQAIDAVAEAALQDRCAPSNPRAAAVADLRAILKEVG